MQVCACVQYCAKVLGTRFFKGKKGKALRHNETQLHLYTAAQIQKTRKFIRMIVKSVSPRTVCVFPT